VTDIPALPPPKLLIWTAENGFMCQTPKGLRIIPTLKGLIDTVQKELCGSRTLTEGQATLSEISLAMQASSAQSDKESTLVCPYCFSENIIGHGFRETSREIQARKFCKDCKRTFVAGRDRMKDEPAPTKVQIEFLLIAGYDKSEIAKELKLSASTIDYHIENIRAENWWRQKNEGQELEQTDSRAKDTQIKPAEPFNLLQVYKEKLGNSFVWDYDGRVAIGRRGMKEIVYVQKTAIERMKKMSTKQLATFISNLNLIHQDIVIGYIEDLKDDAIGALPMLRTGTRPAEDGGEIDADGFEDGSMGIDRSEMDSGIEY
jgi:transposase-like protein